MNTSNNQPGLNAIKAQAKRLRSDLQANGDTISHSRSLELIAHQFGFRDWNTLHATLGNTPPKISVALGDKVSGTYLGQSFTADVIGVRALSSKSDEARLRVTLDLDEAVDVVTFDGFSAFRKRLNANIGPDGKTVEKTSDGRPQLELRLPH